MAKRSLEELQRRYASAARADVRGPGGMHGPGGPRGRRSMGESGKGKYSRTTVRRLLSYVAV